MNPVFLFLIPAIPALSSAILTVFGRTWSTKKAGLTATTAVAISLAFVLSFGHILQHQMGGVNGSIIATLGDWISTQAFKSELSFRLDAMGFAMALLVSGFGFLITLYSVGYMKGDEEPAKFFSAINLFVASMLTLVLSENLVLIFLGWEGVGLCSYLLIGHYWQKDEVPLASFRALFVNRAGDLSFLLGVLLLFKIFGSISLTTLASANLESLPPSAAWWAGIAVIFILGGAFAKSAQAPLHVWLPDAMAGPTPVSALIHAATMVTAGVYLVSRLHPLLDFVPGARMLILICALITLVVGAVLAICQTDIKKILAYSTLSNLALMFLAHSANMPGAAMSHLFGHAAFKALLFLSAGSIIFAAYHEQEAPALEGVLKKLPITRIAVWVGAIGGAGLIPYLSAGFFTKELVLESIQEASFGWGSIHVSSSVIFWIVTAVESLSAIYLFRLLGYLEGTGKGTHSHSHSHLNHTETHEIKESSYSIRFVLIALIGFAFFFALWSSTESMGHLFPSPYAWFTGNGHVPHGPTLSHVWPFLLVNMLLAIFTFSIYRSPTKRKMLTGFASILKVSWGPVTRKFWFDDMIHLLLVVPSRWIGLVCKWVIETVVIGIPDITAWIARNLSILVRRFHTGKTHQYAIFVAILTFVMVWYFADIAGR